MLSVKRTPKAVTKSVRFSPEETALIAEVSRRERVAEGTLLRKLVLDGVARLRLEQALADYQSGELNLGEAAHVAGVSVHRMMAEIDRRGIDVGDERDFGSGLQTLVDLFGGSPELRETIEELRAHPDRAQHAAIKETP